MPGILNFHYNNLSHGFAVTAPLHSGALRLCYKSAVSLHISPQRAVERAVLHGLGYVVGVHGLAAVEIGDGARDAQYFVIRPRGQFELFEHSFEQDHAPRESGGRIFFRLRRVHLCVV